MSDKKSAMDMILGDIPKDNRKITEDKSTKHKPIVVKKEEEKKTSEPGRKHFEDRSKIRNKKIIVPLTEQEFEIFDKYIDEHPEFKSKSNFIRLAIKKICEFSDEEFPNYIIK